MTARLVGDASNIVAMLLDAGPDGRWAAATLSGSGLFAPASMPFECANVVRRLELAGTVSADQAAQAHPDLLEFNVELWSYGLVAARVWALRSNLSYYDTTHVEVAEMLDAALVTLDRRIRRASGLRCSVLTPR